MRWDLLVERADLSRTSLVDVPALEPEEGQVSLKVDRVGMSANNVTYAVFGDAMQYWDFFPVTPRDGGSYGRVPLWGFAVVEKSTLREVGEGTRLSAHGCSVGADRPRPLVRPTATRVAAAGGFRRWCVRGQTKGSSASCTGARSRQEQETPWRMSRRSSTGR